MSRAIDLKEDLHLSKVRLPHDSASPRKKSENKNKNEVRFVNCIDYIKIL
jgi:hypothetical protein